MFGFDVILAYIRKQVGLRTDPASEAGSLHAKIAELRAYIDTELAKIQKPRAVAGAPGSFLTDELTYQTALNISGRGRLVSLGMYREYNAAQAVKVTIDGNVVAWGTGAVTASGSNVWVVPTPQFVLAPGEGPAGSSFGFALASAGGGLWLDLSFKSSLKIETKKLPYEGFTNSAYVCWQYEIEE
jgi:hypothetical protein